MAGIDGDILWPHFKPLWSDLRGLGTGNIQIAGGYGLYLKQLWLRENPERQIVIPLAQWIDATPRVTNDFDLVLDVDLIADEKSNRSALAALEKNGFTVTEKTLGQRWQFVKRLSQDKVILAELHAPTPEPDAPHLRTEKVRIKHKPSLGGDGIHGRHNTEASGSDINPFEFEIDFTQVVVPNPVSWAVMKLTAMQDFWNQANDRAKDARDRAYGRAQAEKHGQDVCRAIAMTTLDERDETAKVVSAIEATLSYLKAMGIFESAFEEGAWARDLVSGYWSAEDLNVLVTVLANWFPIPPH